MANETEGEGHTKRNFSFNPYEKKNYAISVIVCVVKCILYRNICVMKGLDVVQADIT